MADNIDGITIPPLDDTAYATKINNSLSAIDSHDHSDGKGLPVARVANNVVGTSQLVNDSVTIDKMANDSVGTDQLVDESVTRAKIFPRGFGRSSNIVWASTLQADIDVPNSEITVALNGGNPVEVFLDIATTLNSQIAISSINEELCQATIYLADTDDNVYAVFPFGMSLTGGSLTGLDPILTLPGGILRTVLDADNFPTAGNYTFKLTVLEETIDYTIQITGRLTVKEIL